MEIWIRRTKPLGLACGWIYLHLEFDGDLIRPASTSQFNAQRFVALSHPVFRNSRSHFGAQI
jgi:hypothetical protein